MKIITKQDNNGVTCAVQEEGTHNHVSIYDTLGWHFGDDVKPVYGVNWSAHGTVTVQEAEDYVKLMQEAIKIAKEMNK